MKGIAIATRAPPPVGLRAYARPPCAPAIAATIDRPSPEPSDAAADLHAGEPVEDPVQLLLRDPGAAIAHPQFERGLALVGEDDAADRDRRARRGVLGGVLGELQPGLGDARRVELGHHMRGPGERPLVVRAEGAGLREHQVGELGDLDGLPVQEVRATGLHEQRDVVDESVHAVELVDRELARRVDLGGGVGVEQLEMAAHDGDRGAQLVAHVVEQPALGVERALRAGRAWR